MKSGAGSATRFHMGVLAALALALAGCGTTVGPEGPAGPAGPVGPPGTADVIQYNFPGFVHPGDQITFLLPIPFEQVDSLTILPFVKASFFWYPLPGYVTNNFEYRTYQGSANFGNSTVVYMSRMQGAGNQVFDAAKFIAFPSGTEIDMTPVLESMSYEEVVNYFGLDD